MKIVQILSGPYEMEGMVWNLCLVSDGSSEMWDEEIYYDSLAEAIADFEDIRSDGYIDVEDEHWLEDEENGDDW
jgi:hypothetical protein